MTDFRPLRRFKQAASEEECLSILETAQRGILSVIGENGYPYGLPVNFIFLDGKIYFHCAQEGHKLSEPVRNEGEWWYCLTSVIVFGHAREVVDPSETGPLLRVLGEKYFPEGYDIEADIRRNGPRALIIEISPDHISGKHVREK